MKIAILTNTNNVFVEFNEQTFRELLKTYFAQTQDIDKALDAIIVALKEQTVVK
jgi:hypothetical protein